MLYYNNTACKFLSIISAIYILKMPDQKMELAIIGLGKMGGTLPFRLLIRISRS
jgi:hypothetical protein